MSEEIETKTSDVNASRESAEFVAKQKMTMLKMATDMLMEHYHQRIRLEELSANITKKEVPLPSVKDISKLVKQMTKLVFD